MAGTTSPGLQACSPRADPAQMLERAALLDAAARAGPPSWPPSRRPSERAADAAAAARRPRWRRRRRAEAARPPPHWPWPRQMEADARRQAADLQAQQAAMQARLDQARTTLVALQRSGAAAQQAAARRAARPAAAAVRTGRPVPDAVRPPPPVPRRRPAATTGTPSPGASPAATGASTPATATTAACSSARPPGSPSAAAPTPPRADLATKGAADRRRGEGPGRPGPGRLADLRPEPLIAVTCRCLPRRPRPGVTGAHRLGSRGNDGAQGSGTWAGRCW